MSLILDTSALIASERLGESIEDLLRRIRSVYGEIDLALSAVSVVELTHGIYRAKLAESRIKRQIFTDKLFQALVVFPISFEIVQLAGRIEGEQAAKGISIAFEDLLIGASALHHDYDVATLNQKHFQQIPGLNVVSI